MRTENVNFVLLHFLTSVHSVYSSVSFQCSMNIRDKWQGFLEILIFVNIPFQSE